MHLSTVVLTLLVAMNCSSVSGLLSKSNNAASNVSVNAGETNSNNGETADTESQSQVKVERDLLSFAEGTIMPVTFDGLLVTAPILMIDGSEIHNWVGSPDVKAQSFIFEMPDKATLNTLVFDNDTSGMGGVNAGVKDFTIEVSDTSSAAGFQEIISGSLKMGENGQRFAITKAIPGRWVRANFKTNHGGETFSLAEIRGFGDVPNSTLATNVSGTYDILNGSYHIKQEGTTIVGCFEPNSIYANPATFSGGLEGNIGKINYTETLPEGGAGEQTSFLMVFARDGKRFFTGKVDDVGGLSEYGEAKRTSDATGSCKNFHVAKTTVKDHMGSELKKDGRVTLYGINFDFNSDTIRPESKGVLDQVVAMLKENVDLKITIEGHTDNIGGEKFNQSLSDKRATAVKTYLVTAGIAVARLQSTGKGMSSPIASNDSDIGRSQNRRVELVKQ